MPRLFYGKRKLPCPDEFKQALNEEIKKSAPFFGAREINTLDGLRLEFEDSWMLIRASGTEPAVRIIAESISSSNLEMLLTSGTRAVEENLRMVMS